MKSKEPGKEFGFSKAERARFDEGCKVLNTECLFTISNKQAKAISQNLANSARKGPFSTSDLHRIAWGNHRFSRVQIHPTTIQTEWLSGRNMPYYEIARIVQILANTPVLKADRSEHGMFHVCACERTCLKFVRKALKSIRAEEDREITEVLAIEDSNKAAKSAEHCVKNAQDLERLTKDEAFRISTSCSDQDAEGYLKRHAKGRSLP